MSHTKEIPFKIPERVNILQEYHFGYASLRLRSDGITQINTADDTMYSLKETKEVHSMVTKLNGRQPILIMHVPGKHTNADNASRKFLASETGLKNRLAFAFVLQSLAQRIVANFYVRMNKPKRPTKFFSVQKDAEKWLLSVKQDKTGLN